MDNPENELSGIPTSKVQRAAKILGAGAKVGGNYIKYYAKKTINPELSRDSLHENNAESIYSSLSQLKGSALKVAQMMSMDNAILPKAYQDKFAMAQYQAPPLSYPLISKTFTQAFGKRPDELFEQFSKNAVHAASIGQVHRAEKEGKQYAVKIQYPGVADAISSDLKLVKPLAAQLFNMKSSEMNDYLIEVESKMIEETDYELELKRGSEIAENCSFIPHLRFPSYYSTLSNKRILTMDWIEGQMLPEFIATNPSQETRNRLGQSMWDFFLYQMKVLRKVHADPHPGNFIVDKEGNLCVIDFGCVKEIPEEFFENYTLLLNARIFDFPEELKIVYEKIELYRPEDTPRVKEILHEVYGKMIKLLGKPLQLESFDFSDESYFDELFGLGETFANDKEIRKINQARGSKHAIYVLRTFFGLYSILHQLKANVVLNYPLD